MVKNESLERSDFDASSATYLNLLKAVDGQIALSVMWFDKEEECVK